MSTPGPIYRQCPKCRKVFDSVLWDTLVDHDNDSTIFSDGYELNHFRYSNRPTLLKCNCGHENFYYEFDSTLNFDNQLKNLTQVRPLETKEFHDFILSHPGLDVATKYKLRKDLWHRENHKRRPQFQIDSNWRPVVSQEYFPYVDIEKENIEEMIKMIKFPNDEQSCLVLAELHRNLENYRRCLDYLLEIKNNNYDSLVQTIGAEALRKNSQVVEHKYKQLENICII